MLKASSASSCFYQNNLQGPSCNSATEDESGMERLTLKPGGISHPTLPHACRICLCELYPYVNMRFTVAQQQVFQQEHNPHPGLLPGHRYTQRNTGTAAFVGTGEGCSPCCLSGLGFFAPSL